jgi:hypothetical protein
MESDREGLPPLPTPSHFAAAPQPSRSRHIVAAHEGRKRNPEIGRNGAGHGDSAVVFAPEEEGGNARILSQSHNPTIPQLGFGQNFSAGVTTARRPLAGEPPVPPVAGARPFASCRPRPDAPPVRLMPPPARRPARVERSAPLPCCDRFSITIFIRGVRPRGDFRAIGGGLRSSRNTAGFWAFR